MAAPQGYWLSNKFIFTPAPPPVWPEAETLAEAVSAPPYVAQRPRSIFGGDSGDPGVTGNTPHGWAQNVTESELPGWGALTGMFSDPFDSSNTREFEGSRSNVFEPDPYAYDSGEAILFDWPVSERPTGPQVSMRRKPMSSDQPFPRSNMALQTPAERAVAPGTQTGESRFDEKGQDTTTPEYKAAKDIQTVAKWAAFPVSKIASSMIGNSRAGPLGEVGPYTQDAFGNYRYNAAGPMGTKQAPLGQYVGGFNPNVATNDFTGAFGLGTLGNTGRSMTPAMFDSSGLALGGPHGYGYGFKRGGGIGALDYKDVYDVHSDEWASDDLGPVDGWDSVDDSNWDAEDFAAEDYSADFAYHHGGMVEGPDPETEGEEFQAEMLEGEYVIRPEVVELLGPEFFDRLNKLFEK
jgi:hypothetical protein|tara:strand:- start:10675 stop:11895 length:1221 start_codon:yes stop_codon:yes gene_type:complete